MPPHSSSWTPAAYEASSGSDVWVELYDDVKSKTYYWNRRTRLSSWLPPEGIKVVWVGMRDTEGRSTTDTTKHVPVLGSFLLFLLADGLRGEGLGTPSPHLGCLSRRRQRRHVHGWCCWSSTSCCAPSCWCQAHGSLHHGRYGPEVQYVGASLVCSRMFTSRCVSSCLQAHDALHHGRFGPEGLFTGSGMCKAGIAGMACPLFLRQLLGVGLCRKLWRFRSYRWCSSWRLLTRPLFLYDRCLCWSRQCRIP